MNYTIPTKLVEDLIQAVDRLPLEGALTLADACRLWLESDPPRPEGCPQFIVRLARYAAQFNSAETERLAKEAFEWLMDLRSRVPEVGSYVLATKYGDGDPCDHFCIGFVLEVRNYSERDVRYIVMGNDGNLFRATGFRKSVTITKEEGKRLLAIFPEIGDVPGPSLWTRLEQVRDQIRLEHTRNGDSEGGDGGREGELALTPFLKLLEQDIEQNPERLKPVLSGLVGRLHDLVGGIRVDLEAPLPQDCPDPGDSPNSVSINTHGHGSTDPSKISDGYHTFEELYEHRHVLFLSLMRCLGDLSWFSKRHFDGEVPFGDENWFIAGISLPLAGEITYHLPMRLWPDAVATGATQRERGKEWDGHTPSDVVTRLLTFATSLAH